MASCQTSQWGTSSPYVKLTVTESSYATTSKLSWKLQYIAKYAADTDYSKSYTVKINGDTEKSGMYSINGKTGTNTIASGTKTITKTKSSQTISFSVSFAFNLEWSGIYKGTLTADDSISVSAMSKYTVKYNPNGGSGGPSSQSQWCNQNLTLSTETPSRTGYTFLGWSTSSSATSATWSAGGSYTAKVSDVLYAVWKIKTYTIKYDLNGVSGTIPNDTKTYGKALTLSTTKPTRTGYTFLGWSLNNKATKATWSAGGSYTTNESNTLYAVWKKITYTIKYNPNGGSGAPSDQIKTHDVTLKLSPTKPTRTGYTFLGWSLDNKATTKTWSAGADYTDNESNILYAVWTLSYFKPKISNFKVFRCNENGDINYSLTTSAPDNWSTEYTSYYTKNNNVYTQVTGDSAPTWTANTYYSKIKDSELTHVKATFSWKTYNDVTVIDIRVLDILKETYTGTWDIKMNKGISGKSGSVTTDPLNALTSDLVLTDLSVNESYIIELKISDDKGSTIETRTLSSRKIPLDLKAGGNGIAFGKSAEKEGYAEFYYKLWSANGEFLSSPIELASNTDLNTVMYPGHYIAPNVSISQTIKSKPTTFDKNDTTFYLDVFVGGSEGQKIQRYTREDKDDQFVWQRCYYTNSWGNWYLIAGTCDWRNLTLNTSKFKYYNNNEANRPKYKVSGSVVEVKGIVTPKSDIDTINTTKLIIASGIPTCFCPDTERLYVSQGSSINRWAFSIQTDGNITISRYGVSTYPTVASGTLLPFNATYLI